MVAGWHRVALHVFARKCDYPERQPCFMKRFLWIFLCLYCLQMIPSAKLKAENNTDLVQRGTVVQSIHHQSRLRPFYVHFVHSLCGFLSGKSSFLSQTKNTRLFGVCVWMVCMRSGRLAMCPGYSFSLTQQQLTVNDVLLPHKEKVSSRPGAVPRLSSTSEFHVSPYLCGFYSY